MNMLEQMAMTIIQNNEEVQKSPMGQQLAQILQNGDQAAGIALANNIMKTYGLKKDQAIQQAAQGLRQKGLRF